MTRVRRARLTAATMLAAAAFAVAGCSDAAPAPAAPGPAAQTAPVPTAPPAAPAPPVAPDEPSPEVEGGEGEGEVTAADLLPPGVRDGQPPNGAICGYDEGVPVCDAERYVEMVDQSQREVACIEEQARRSPDGAAADPGACAGVGG